jgi:phenylacetate-coenzyme A ligase PaaK-like adenylate-forming protein
VSGLGRLIEALPQYAALLRSQYWPAEKLESYRVRQLEKTFRAASKIPFYAERFGAAWRAGDLQKLPVLKRSEVEPLCLSVRSLYPPGTSFVSERSSGTSGVAVTLLFDTSHQGGPQRRTDPLPAREWMESAQVQRLADGLVAGDGAQSGLSRPR